MDVGLLFCFLFIGALYLIAGICFVEAWKDAFNDISYRSVRASARIVALVFWPVGAALWVALAIVAVIVMIVMDLCE